MPPVTPRDASSSRKTPQQKLSTVLRLISELNWTTGEFLYELFRTKDENGGSISRDASHRAVVCMFLGGRSRRTFSDILDAVLQDPMGRALKDSEDEKDMYSQIKPFTDIKVAHPAITTMAVQLVRSRLLKDMGTVVKGSSGLHGSLKGEQSGARRHLQWTDISPSTIKTAENIFRQHHSLAFHLILRMTTPPPRKTSGALVTVRKMRPPALVSTEILSDIAFSRTQYARLLPMARAILYFACGAQETLFRYNSRVGHTPSFNTTVATLKRLAQLDAAYVRVLGRDWTRGVVVRTDNVQTYVKRMAYRVGRKNYMKIGLTATVAEAVDFDSAAVDLDDKRARIATNMRAKLTVEQLLGMIDYDHLERVGILQWLQVLVNYIPQLAKYKGKVAELYRTDGAKLLLPRARKTSVFPLATVAKNENVTPEFRDALIDFLDQLGQADSKFDRCLIFVGGDGLTYERLKQLKMYLRDQSNEFRTLEIIHPFLETWHTQWTYLSLLCEAHWGAPLTKDPSKLGHSATKIKQKTPTNLAKVDYYPAAYTVYVVLDVRMLDCWRLYFGVDDIFEYFTQLQQEDKLPTLVDLQMQAKVLYKRYSTRKAYNEARTGQRREGDVRVPTGSTWIPRSAETTKSQSKAANKKQKTSASRSASGKTDTNLPFTGDQALAQSIMFMHDAMLSREVAQAVAEGDVGRVYEGLKMMLFSFAGSSHTKYASYLLEMICDLELESSPALRELFLRNWLVNTSGEAGRYHEGDLMQEHYNRELETFIDRKDTQWDADYIRKVIAPNVGRFVALKNTWGEGVGLAQRRGKHPEPHSRSELSILLRTYKEEDLHRFREGRYYGSPTDDVDTFSEGIRRLYDGKLEKWITETTRTRTTSTTESPEAELYHGENEAEAEDNDQADDEDKGTSWRAMGSMEMIDGELVVHHEHQEWSDVLREGESELLEAEDEGDGVDVLAPDDAREIDETYW